MAHALLHSLRARLILIVLAALIPCGLYTVYTFDESVRYARIEAVEQARRLAILTASNGRALFDSGRQLLATCAQMPKDILLDPGRSNAFFTQLLDLNPDYANIALADTAGRPLVSTLQVPEGLSVADAPWFKDTIAGRDFVISSPVFCRIAKKPAIILAAPIRDAGGGICHVLALTMESAWIRRVIDGVPLPENTTVSVVDGNGAFLARFPDTIPWVDRSVPGSARIFGENRKLEIDSIEADGLDGVNRLYAFASLLGQPGTELFVRIGIPTKTAYAGAKQAFVRNLLILIAVGGLAIIATAVFGNVIILRHTNGLLAATRRLAGGDLSFRIGAPHAKGELAQIAHSFDAMADALERQARSLRQAEKNYRGIFENAPIGIVQSSPEGRYLAANDALARIYGYDDAADLMASVDDIKTQIYADPAQFDELRRILSDKGEVTNFEVLAKRKDGRLVWTSRNMRAVHDDSGNLLYFDGFTIDIDLRKRAEAQLLDSSLRKHQMAVKLASMVRALRAARAAADDANRAKSDFLARMSHEIRTPIHAVLGLAEAALHTPLSAEQRDYLDTILESTQTLLALINDILDFSKIEAKKLRLEQVDFDPREAVQSTVHTMAVAAEVKGLRLNLDVAREVPTAVKGDPGRLRQILINLLGNAIKFTTRGEVSVKVGLGGDGRDDGRVALAFEVADTGEGMTPGQIESVFDAFRQADDSVARRHGGSGLGLSICKELVAMMGGLISANSSPGRGSVFSFTVVLSPGDQAKIVNSARAQTSSSPPRPLTVLLVEDNPVNVKVGLAHLGRMGHACDVAESGLAAISALERKHYDAVLMDLEMPDMDGFETTRRIRRGEAGEQAKTVAIVALTAHAVADYRKRCLESGMDDYISKPVNYREMAAILDRIAGGGEGGAGPGACTIADLNVLETDAALERLDGDRELYREIVATVLEDMPDKIKQMRLAASSGDLKLARLTAHGVKTNALIVGACSCAAVALELENAARLGQTDRIAELAARTEAEMLKVREMLAG